MSYSHCESLTPMNPCLTAIYLNYFSYLHFAAADFIAVIGKMNIARSATVVITIALYLYEF